MSTRRYVCCRYSDDSGSATLELAVLTPALLALLMLTIAAGRITHAESLVDAAARDGARAASLERSAEAAQIAAESTVAASLGGNVTCRSTGVDVDGQFGAGVGTSASVRVTVGCRVDLTDVALPGLPGAKTLTAEYASVLDTYRGR